MPTIALVDDDRNILTSVSIALEAEGYRINTYADGVSALVGFQTAPPDLAILDIKMPRMDGMETLRRLRQKSDLPVIFLTSKEEEMDELFGLKMGPMTSSVNLSRIGFWSNASRFCCAGPGPGTALRRWKPVATFWSAENCVWTQNVKPAPGKRAVTLTVTEFLILQSLASRPGVVKSRNTLMDAAYDEDVYVDDRTIDSHIKRLRRKFRARDREFDMVETLYGIGYRFKEE